MGFDRVSVSLSLDSITATVRRAGEWVTVMREIRPPGINAWRIAELERFAKSAGPGLVPSAIAVKISEIESTAPHYSGAQIAAAVAAASGAFAFLNGADVPEMIAAAIGGGIGQWVRLLLSRRELNHYGVAALSAVVASSVYVQTAMLARYAGVEFSHYPAGFIASVLFLIPGFPLIAALFDLLQYQAVGAVSRLAYGVMILLAVAFGLSIVVGLAGIDLSRQPPLELAHPLKLLLRAIASFVAGCAFAMLFNSSPRTALTAGFLALGANDLRLILNDMGMMLAPAAFFRAGCWDRGPGDGSVLRRAAYGGGRGTGRYHGAGHVCVRDVRIVQPRTNTRRPSGLRLMRLCPWRVGDGPGDRSCFQPAIILVLTTIGEGATRFRRDATISPIIDYDPCYSASIHGRVRLWFRRSYSRTRRTRRKRLQLKSSRDHAASKPADISTWLGEDFRETCTLCSI